MALPVGLIDTVNATDEEIVITKKGRPAAVPASPEDFESLEETVSVRSDAALMKEMRRGPGAPKPKKAKVFTPRRVI